MDMLHELNVQNKQVELIGKNFTSLLNDPFISQMYVFVASRDIIENI